MLRWKHIEKLFKNEGLICLFSTDGYPSFLAAMKGLTRFGKKYYEHNVPIPFMCDKEASIKAFQDAVHLLNKFRTRLMDTSCILKLGNYIASMNFLKILVKNPNVSKNDHNLNASDIGTYDPSADKMNQKSSEKICQQSVIDLLERYVDGSDGTGAFLKVMQNIYNAFLNPTTTPLQRLYCAFFSLIFLRIWRNNLSKKESECFVSSNVWSSLELNSVFLYQLTLQGNGHLVLVWNSQPCEEFFRQLRSMTSHNLTQINFNFLESLQKINRIEKINELVYDLKDVFDLEENLKMKSDAKEESQIPIYFPTQQECSDSISAALKDAIELCRNLGMKKLECCDPDKFLKNTNIEPNEVQCHVEERTGESFVAPDYVCPPESITSTEIALCSHEKKIIKIKNFYLIDEPSSKFEC